MISVFSADFDIIIQVLLFFQYQLTACYNNLEIHLDLLSNCIFISLEQFHQIHQVSFLFSFRIIVWCRHYKNKNLMILILIRLSQLDHILQNRLNSLYWSICVDVLQTAIRMQNKSSSIQRTSICFAVVLVENISFFLNLSMKLFISMMLNLLLYNISL